MKFRKNQRLVNKLDNKLEYKILDLDIEFSQYHVEFLTGYQKGTDWKDAAEIEFFLIPKPKKEEVK